MNIFADIVKKLIEKGWYLAAAESCTGGLFSAGIVDIPDASKVLQASFVTYSEWAKEAFAGVAPEVIEQNGVVSEEVAVAMAKGAAASAGAEVGVGITGIAGPSGGTSERPVGTVCFGFCVNGRTMSSTQHFGNVGRSIVREMSTVFAAQTLSRFLDIF